MVKISNSPKKNRWGRILRFLYLKLFRINDTPHRIAAGAALGVFFGVLPAAGVIVALCGAIIFRVNRAAAMIAALATNTWISVAIFLLSIKVGAFIMKVDWRAVYAQSRGFFRDFQAAEFFSFSTVRILLPVIIGYAVLAIGLSIITYTLAIIAVRRFQYARKNRINLPRKS
jgi:uncharacterized protein (DUF2062 family)